MSVPLDLNLIQRLLNEQEYGGDLNTLQRQGFYFVDQNDPELHVPNTQHWGHVIVSKGINYAQIAQLWIDDNYNGSGAPHIYYRIFNGKIWVNWKEIATLDDLPDLSAYAKKSDLPNLSNFVTMAQVTAEVTRVLTTAEF